jgi:N-acetylgalactosamine-6-sulfatase
MERIALGWFIAVGVLFAATPARAAAERPPNIVFLLADDLGFGDLGCYGHPYARTPNIDRLAAEGTRFTQFYVTGVTCCPSRTGFMTSRWPASFAVYPANGGFADRVTVTELLKQAGYATGHFGKWHIGPETKPGTYGIDATPHTGETAGAKRDDRGRDAPIYDAAIRFIEAHRDRPFYVNVWGHTTHHPVHPPAAYVERFRDLKVNEADFAPPMREKFAACRERGGDVEVAMRNYLGDIAALDDSVGRLLRRLDELGLRETTIVVFSSDHGAPAIPLAEKSTDKAKQKRREAAPAAEAAERFALSLNLMGYNGGFRGGKHGMYEGGVRVPFVIRWPGRVPAARVDERSVTSGIDWLPTLCAIAGIKIEAGRFEGEDVTEAWLGGTHVRAKPLLWKTSAPVSPAGIRAGQWKLIQPARRRGEVELYDLARDPGETTNVAAQHPEVVERLAPQVIAWMETLPKEYVKGANADD